MPIYESKNKEVKDLKGLHLYHFVFSNCSQRVRIVLFEKGLSWVSHHLDLSKNEHITPEYQELNPKGVVPTLVCDGEVVVESNDIIAYLDDKYPIPSLVPDCDSERVFMESFVRLAGETQGQVKVLSFDRLFRGLLNVDAEELEFLEHNRNNSDVLQFMEDFHDNSEAWDLRVKDATSVIEKVLARLNDGLQKNRWLSGKAYGLADISWVVNIHRIGIIGLSMDEYPYLQDWYQRCVDRAAFQEAVVNYQP